MITPLVIPLAKDTVCKWTYSSGLVSQTGTAYIDNVEYQINYGNIQSPQLLRVYNSEGYSANINGSWAFNYYRKDHLGNIREVWRAAYVRGVATNIAANTDQRTQYYPSGLPWAEGQNPSDQQRKFNGKEFDEMSGYDTYDYGARGYYPALGCFQSVDPMCEKYYNISPYAYCLNNPVRYNDPDGRWIPDAEGNLIAEKGDDAQTLANFQGVENSEALNQMNEQGFTVDDKGILNLEVGDKVTLDNVYTESMQNSTSDLTLDAAISGTSKTGATPEDNYNCWGSAIAGTQGKEIKVGVGIDQGNTFDKDLKSDYTSITSENAEFGKTVVRFSNDNNEVQHGAVFYGKSQDGTTYVYTKNGWQLKPEVMKLSNLQIKIPSYGKVQGIEKNESGYYNPK